MVNKKLIIGIILMVSMLRMPVIGCDEINNEIYGTWVSEDGNEMIFNNGYFVSLTNNISSKGTYTTFGDKIEILTTHLYGAYNMEEHDSRWYTIRELAEIWRYDYNYENNCLSKKNENDQSEYIDFKVIGEYSINDNKLILIIMNESSIYTKKISL